MPKEKQVEQFDPEEEEINKKLEEIGKRKKERQYEKQVEAAKANFKNKQEKLLDRAADFMIKYGKDDYRTQIMTTFLDVAQQMQDVIDLTHDVSMAMSCITEAIGCMDDIMHINELQLQSTLEVNYGFFARLRRKRQLKRAISNNAGRMKQICDTLVGSQKMAQSMTSALQASSIKMQIMMQKNNLRQQKKRLKANPSAVGTPTAAELEVMKRAEQKRGASGEGGTAPAPDMGSTSPAAGSGTVDISDI